MTFYIAKHIIDTYRRYGALGSKVDPLNIPIEFNIENLIGDIDKNLILQIDNYAFQKSVCSAGHLISLLQNTYASSVAVECDDVLNARDWLYSALESFVLPSVNHRDILHFLIEIEALEQYIHAKFPGMKRFSIEGTDSLILALNYLVDSYANGGVHELVLGMSHRGRLTTMCQVFAKSYRTLFSEFLNYNAQGDVKYHLGYFATRGGIKMRMMHNPSHLESINAVLSGYVKAAQDISYDGDKSKVVGVLVHGDAAFCGQGVVMESLTLSTLDLYNTGGIIHFIVNNQIGFTTSCFEARRSRFPTNIASCLHIPVLHVNAYDVLAVLRCVAIAINYKDKFHSDIIIDIVGYRKYGHNEGDDPTYTHSLMYNTICGMSSIADSYAQNAAEHGVLEYSEYRLYKSEFKKTLDLEFSAANYTPQMVMEHDVKQKYTGISEHTINTIIESVTILPTWFVCHPKIVKLFQSERLLIQSKKKLSFIAAEWLAIGSLLLDGVHVRMVGQDSARGTFSQRHGALYDQTTGTRYVPLAGLSPGKFTIGNTPLSEYAALGFEYGHSLVEGTLTIWEAQFGDFANGAQIIFDQFISSAEAKWGQLSNIVVLLPHGYDGQGPEHSSARIERFLELAECNNMRIIHPSTSVSYFHALRRQAKSNKPLIVFTPKSILRAEYAYSDLVAVEEESSPVYGDYVQGATRMILCSGQVYYDLVQYRTKHNLKAAIIRIEEYYPFPIEKLRDLIKRYNIETYVWCQEEPENMGAWFFVKRQMSSMSPTHTAIQYAGRPPAASPATGSFKVHVEEQSRLISSAFTS